MNEIDSVPGGTDSAARKRLGRVSVPVWLGILSYRLSQTDRSAEISPSTLHLPFHTHVCPGVALTGTVFVSMLHKRDPDAACYAEPSCVRAQQSRGQEAQRHERRG